MTSVSGPASIANLGLSAPGQTKLKELDKDGNGTLTRGELDQAVAQRYTASCTPEQGGLCISDPDSSSIAEVELRIQLGFSAEDAQKISARVQAHSSDPTSPLVQFGEPSPTEVLGAETVAPELAATESAPPEVASTETAPPATATKPLESQPDLPALTTQPGMVLRGDPLKARLKELEDQSQKGIERLETRIQELGDKAPAEMKASLEKLKELKALLASSDPKAVEKLQTFLTANNGSRSGDQAFEKRLEYQSNGQTKTCDNLYGKRTDACLRDLIMELGNQEPPAAAPVDNTATNTDVPVADDGAVAHAESPTVSADLNTPLLTGAGSLFGLNGTPTSFNAGTLTATGNDAFSLTRPFSLYTPSSTSSSLMFGPRTDLGATSNFSLTNPALSFGRTNPTFTTIPGFDTDFSYRPPAFSFTNYNSTDLLGRYSMGTVQD